jgi:hypothetical protein
MYSASGEKVELSKIYTFEHLQRAADRIGLNLEAACVEGANGYASLMVKMITYISHYEKFITCDSQVCEAKQANMIVNSVMSYLHLRPQPTLIDQITFVCGPVCEAEAHLGMKELKKSMGYSRESRMVCAFKSCSKAEGLMCCSRCRLVYYCSAKHQREHYRDHKAFCKASAERQKSSKEAQA